MSAKRGCPECGASLTSNAPEGLCPRCLMGAGETGSTSVRVGPGVDLDGFRRAVLEVGLAGSTSLDLLAERAAGDLSGLARLLVKAGKLTPYQAEALMQGKARGLVIGPCLVLERRGQGGMGVVFKARHRESGRVVALKILLPSFGRDRDAVARFRREFEIAARIDHPNVVAALEASEDRGVQFLTMEYVEGHDLNELVKSVGPLPIKQALHCAIQAARGLAAAHALGIVHRDVKPGNLMLDKVGLVRVLDLGLARVIESTGALTMGAATGLTRSGAYLGTADYLAPEQADDPKKATHRADVYALGCTIHYLLTGRPPFGRGTILQQLMAHQNEPAPSLLDARDDVPDPLEHIYLEVMAKGPDERPGSMAEVAARLESCRASADEAREARDGLMSFAETVLKRASPRKRGRNPDASVFARRPDPGGLQFDPDLDLEDLVMDYREEARVDPLTDGEMPPVLPRVPLSRSGRRRGPGLKLLGAAGALSACLAVFALIPRGGRDAGPAPPSASKAGPDPKPVAPASPGFVPLFNGQDLAGWKEVDGKPVVARVVDGVLVIGGGGRGFTGLMTNRAFGSFRLRVEFQDPGEVDGGVWLIDADGAATSRICAEFNVNGDGNASPPMATLSLNGGSGFKNFKPKATAPPPADGWNILELTLKDRKQTVIFNGKPVDYGVNLTNTGDHFIGLQDYKGTVRYRKVEIQELTDESSAAPTLAKGPRASEVLFADDYETPRAYWTATTPEQLAGDPGHRWGHRDGIYFDELQNGRWHGEPLPDGPYPDFSCEVVGRITGDKPTSKGFFIVHLVNDGWGVEILIDGTGALFVAPWGWDRSSNTPWIGPIRNPAIHPGAGQFNNVRLVVRRRKLEVFVNSVRVLNPLVFDRDLTPARVYLGVTCRVPTVRAEFDRVEIRAVGEEPTEAIEAKDVQAKPVRVPNDGGLIMPDGSQVFEGAQLKIDFATGGNPRTQENMDDFAPSAWTNHRQLLWTGNKQGNVLALAVPVEEQGQYEIRALLTTADDYGRVKLEIDGKPLGTGPFLDLYSPRVRNTGAVKLGFVTLGRGTSTFKVTVVGRNRSSGGFGFGLDELQLVPVR